jgi:hypothetical protein
VFSDENLLPLEDRNGPQGTWYEDPTGETDKKLVMPVSIEMKEAEDNISANNLRVKSRPDGREEEAEKSKNSSIEIISPTESKNSRQEGQVS